MKSADYDDADKKIPDSCIGCLVFLILLIGSIYGFSHYFGLNLKADNMVKAAKEKIENQKFSATADWQEYKRFLDKDDFIFIKGRGDVIVKMGEKEEKIDLNEIEPYRLSMPIECKPSIKFLNISPGDYCQFETHSYLEKKWETKKKRSGILSIVFGILMLMIMLGGIGFITNYRSKEERKEEIKKKIGI